MIQKKWRGIENLKIFFILVFFVTIVNELLILVKNPLQDNFLNLLSNSWGGLSGGIVFSSLSIILSLLFIIGYRYKLKLAWFASLLFFFIFSFTNLLNVIFFFNLFSFIIVALSGYVIYYLIKKRVLFEDNR